MFRYPDLQTVDMMRLFALSPNPYVILDPALTIVGMNEAYLAVTMRRREDILGRTMFEAFPSEPGSVSERMLRASLEKVLRTGETDHLPLIPYPIAAPDGRLDHRYWSATHTAVPGRDGAVRYVLQHTVDVTELHLLREAAAETGLQIGTDILRRAGAVADENLALTEKRNYLEALFEQAPGFMAVLSGPQHRFDLANAAYQSVVGDRPLLGLTVAEALPEVVEQGFVDRLDRVFSRGEPYVAHAAPVVLKRGTHGQTEMRFLDFLYQPIRGTDGRVIGIFVQGHDVTTQKQAQEAALRNEARFRTLAQSIPNHAWTVDRDGLLEWCNDRVFDYVGIAPEALLGRRLGSTVHPDDRERLLSAWEAARATATPFHAEARIRRADGVYRWHLTSALPIFAGDGSIERWTGSNTDIDDQKRTEAQLEFLATTLEERIHERTRELEAAEETLRQAQKMEAIGNLAGGIAHDFNNLLQVISGSLQLLARSLRDERALKLLDNAAAAAGRGAQLASQLLSFGRRQPLEPQVVNLARTVSAMEPLLRRSLGEGIQIETDVTADLWNTLVDPTNVETALLNLAINARDAMKGHGRLTIRLGNAGFDRPEMRLGTEIQPGDYVVLSVADTGAGIAPDILGKVFEPFFTTKEEGKGTGLGLSMVYGFVLQSRGHVTIESAPGAGTTLSLYLPRSREAERRLPPSEGEVVGGSETILVVEDDDAVRETAVALLRDLGYRVLIARDPLNAWAILESGIAVDLIFTDVIMPGALKSIELARRARALKPSIGVLFTSGYTENFIVHDGRLDSGVDFLAKPWSREQLARRMRQALDRLKPLPVSGAATQVPAPTVLVCEDEVLIRMLTVDALESAGMQVREAGSLRQALEQLDPSVDCLVTDMTLPDGNGRHLIEAARSRFPRLPVVIATGGLPDPDGIADGAFLPKPFDEQVLVRTIRGLIAASPVETRAGV